MSVHPHGLTTHGLNVRFYMRLPLFVRAGIELIRHTVPAVGFLGFLRGASSTSSVSRLRLSGRMK